MNLFMLIGSRCANFGIWICLVCTAEFWSSGR